MRRLAVALTGIALMLLVPLLSIEIGLRFLPVNTGLGTQPVDAAHPVYRFEPNRAFIYSKDWDFALVNRGRTNNAGYINDRDYEAAASGPLLAVIGDSYVEAMMVPFAQTIAGRLAHALEGRGRAYSFAASGAPLSQYLVWIDHARRAYRPDGFVVVVVGNDFDESLRVYKSAPGFHYYDRTAGGDLALTRSDYTPGLLRRIVAATALGRYLYMNAQVTYRGPMLMQRLAALFSSAPPPAYVANTEARADEQRVALSQEAVRAFFRDLPAAAGVAPERIQFVVDGVRYPADLAAAQRSFFVVMRNYFLAEARRRGYAAADMQPAFLARHAKDGARFDYLPIDEHWNSIAHGLAAEAVISGEPFRRIFGP